MHVHGQMIRRVIVIVTLGAAAFVVAILTATSASAATTGSFALKASVAGGITTIQSGQTLTFVFTEINQPTKGANEDLGLVRMANVSVADMVCVLPGGAAINPDTPFCEPGLVKPGQHAAMVLTTTVTGAPGAAAKARVCLVNEATNRRGPCMRLSVPIV